MFCFFIVDGVGFSLSPAEFVFKNVCCCYFDESTVEFTAFIDYIRNFSLSLYSFCALHRACTVLRAQRSITYARARCARAHTRTHCFMRLNKLNNKCLQKQITLSCQSSVCLASLFNTNFI